MNFMHTDFIGIYENVFSADYCDSVVEKIDKANNCGFGFNRKAFEDMLNVQKNDTQLFANYLVDASSVFSDETWVHFNTVFWNVCYEAYSTQYDIIKTLPDHTIHGNKLQKTDIGQGYHMWHCEHSDGKAADRLLAYIVYLNDVEEGGETEFLYQHKRVKPSKGTVVIFPAGFTHTHRGNPPLSNSKYIMTGWIEY